MNKNLYAVSSDRGKLKLAGEDIYWFDEGVKRFCFVRKYIKFLRRYKMG